MQKGKVNLLEGDILKKLIILSAPLMATAFVQMTYNFVDIVWLGKLGTKEVAAVGAAGIFIWLASSIIVIARVGANVYASQYYGARNEDKFNDTVKNSLFLVFFVSIIYLVLILFFAEYILSFFNLSPEVTTIGANYLRIISFGFIFHFANPLFSALYSSIGNSYSPFLINAIGLVLNIILDPILIFGLGPIPPMGAFGAGLATSLSQMLVCLVFLFRMRKENNEIYRGLRRGRINLSSMKDIVFMGAPAGLQNAIMASISMVLNKFVASYGEMPMAVYTIGTNIESITWMTTEGFQGGIIAFVGQNYGARLISRLKEIIRKSIEVVGTIGIIATIILISFRHNLFYIFLPGDVVAAQEGAVFLLILGLSQFFMSIEIGASGVFHGLGLTRVPSIISIFFNFFRIPLAILLMKYYGYYGVWIAVTISSIFKGLVSNIILYKKYHNLA